MTEYSSLESDTQFLRDRNDGMLPGAGDTTGSYNARVDAFRRKQQDEEDQAAAKASRDSQNAQIKAEKERASAIKSVAGAEDKNTKAFVKDVFAPKVGELESQKSEIEDAWKKDESASKGWAGLFKDRTAEARLPLHKAQWEQAQAELDKWQAGTTELETSTRKLVAKADAIKDIEFAKDKATVSGNPDDFGNSIAQTLPNRFKPETEKDYADEYEGEMARQGYPLKRQPAPAATAAPAAAQTPQTKPDQAKVGAPAVSRQASDEANYLRGRKAIQNEDIRSQINMPEFKALSPEQKKAKTQELLAAKQAKLDAYDASQGQNQALQTIVGDAQGITGYEAANGITMANLGKEIGRRSASAGNAAMGSFAELYSGSLDLFSAGQSALFGSDPKESWAFQQAGFVRDYWNRNISEEDRDAAATKLAQGMASAMTFMVPAAGALRLGLGGTKAALGVGNLVSKIPMLGRSVAAMDAAKKGIYGANFIASAISGGVMNAGGTFSESVNQGMPLGQAYARTAAAFGIGLSESVGVGAVLGKVNALAKGAVSKFLMGIALEGGVEEGAQELFQSAAADIADLFILDKNDPRRKALGQIAADSMESGAWGAATGMLFTGLMATAARRGLKKDYEKNGNVLAKMDKETAHMTPEARFAQAAQFLNDKNDVVNAKRAELQETLAKITDTTPTQDVIENGEVKSEGSETLRKRAQAIQAEIDANLVHPDAVGIAADLTNDTTGKYKANEARIAELKQKEKVATPAKETFWHPSDYEEIVGIQQELGIALKERKTQFSGDFNSETEQAFKNALPVSQEIQKNYPDDAADPNGNGVKNGSNQRAIAKAVYRLATTGQLAPGDQHLKGSNGALIFAKPGKDGHVVISNLGTLESLQRAPLLGTLYENHAKNPGLALQRVREEQALRLREQEARSLRDKQAAEESAKADASASPANRPSQRQVLTRKAEPGIYEVGAKSLMGDGFHPSVKPFKVEANSEEEALQKAANMAPVMAPGNHEWAVQNVLKVPVEAQYEAVPEAAPAAEVPKPAASEGNAKLIEEAVARHPKRIAEKIAELDIEIAKAKTEDLEALQSARNLLVAQMNMDPELVRAEATRAMGIVGDLVDFFGKAFSSVEINIGATGSGGMVYRGDTGTLQIWTNEVTADKKRMTAVAVEEWIHRVLSEAGIDVNEIYRASKEGKAATLTAYAAVAGRSENQQAHEYIRIALQKYLKFTEGGKLVWSNEAEGTTTEQSIPSLGILQKIKAALQAIMDSWNRLVTQNGSTKASKEALEAIKVIKENLKTINGEIAKQEQVAEEAEIESQQEQAPEVAPAPEVDLEPAPEVSKDPDWSVEDDTPQELQAPKLDADAIFSEITKLEGGKGAAKTPIFNILTTAPLDTLPARIEAGYTNTSNPAKFAAILYKTQEFLTAYAQELQANPDKAAELKKVTDRLAILAKASEYISSIEADREAKAELEASTHNLVDSIKASGRVSKTGHNGQQGDIDKILNGTGRGGGLTQEQRRRIADVFTDDAGIPLDIMRGNLQSRGFSQYEDGGIDAMLHDIESYIKDGTNAAAHGRGAQGAYMSQGLTASSENASLRHERNLEANSPKNSRTTDLWNPDLSDPRDSAIPANFRAERPPLSRKELRAVNSSIDQARKAVESLGYSLRVLDRANASESEKSARMERDGILAAFDSKEERIFIAPIFFDFVTGNDMAKRYLREELIHAAQLKAADNEYQADPQRNESATSHLTRRLEGILSELEKSDKGKGLVVASVEAYTGERQTYESANAKIDDEGLGSMLELWRQVQQIREKTGLSEDSMVSVYRQLRIWLQQALNILRRQAKQTPGPLLDEAVNETIAILNGVGAPAQALMSQRNLPTEEALHERIAYFKDLKNRFIAKHGTEKIKATPALMDHWNEWNREIVMSEMQIEEVKKGFQKDNPDSWPDTEEFDKLGDEWDRLNAYRERLEDMQTDAEEEDETQGASMIGQRIAAIEKKMSAISDRAEKMNDAAGQGMLFSQGPTAPAFYSKMEESLNRKIQGKFASPQQLKAILNNPQDVKPEEVKWSGILPKIDAMAQDNGGKVPMDDLRAWMAQEGRVKFNEVTLGHSTDTMYDAQELYQSDAEQESRAPWANMSEGERSDWATDNIIAPLTSAPKFASYTLPDGDNYRELVLAIPPARMDFSDGQENAWNGYAQKAYGKPYSELSEGLQRITRENTQFLVDPIDKSKTYYSSHFGDILNYVAHTRINDRTDSQGRPGTFIEEIQSDRHQQAREKGYKGDLKIKEGELPDGFTIKQIHDNLWMWEGGENYGQEFTKRDAIKAANHYYMMGDRGAIPDAPHRKDWALAMFKRALRDAVKDGHQWIGWTSGQTQADRYDLSKQVDEIHYFPNEDGTFDMQVAKGGSVIHRENKATTSRIADVVGKEIADKIAKGEGTQTADGKTLSGLDLKVGGEGMRGFYDQILPKEIQKYVKQWGGQVERGEVRHSKPMPAEDPIFSIPQEVSDEIRDIAEMNLERNGIREGKTTREQERYREAFYEEEERLARNWLEKHNKKKIETTPIWQITITPAMRDSIASKGQALFSQSATPEQRAQSAGQLLFEFAPSAKAATDDRNAPLTPEQAQMVADNMGLAHKVANKVANYTGWEREDADQEAMIGLSKAARAFDPAKGTKFSSFAMRVIQNHMTTKGRPTMRRALAESVSLDESAAALDGDITTRKDMLTGDLGATQAQPDAAGLAKFREIAATLPERIRTMLEEYGSGSTFDQIGKRRGISRQGVQQAMAKGTAQLVKRLTEAGITSATDIFPDTTRDESTYTNARKEALIEQDDAESAQATAEHQDDWQARTGRVEDMEEALMSQSALVDAYMKISENDQSFQFPKVSETEKDLSEITRIVSKGQGHIEHRENGIIDIYVTPRNFVRITPSKGGYRINSTVVNMNRVEGNYGAMGYQIAGTWAHNNGFPIVPSGEITGMNVLRRTSNMISNILRFGGETQHWTPHTDQGIKWTQGDDVNNLRSLLEKESQIVLDKIPELRSMFTDGTKIFARTPGGIRKIPGHIFIPSLAARFGVSDGIGETTVRRALLTRSLNDDKLRGRIQKNLARNDGHGPRRSGEIGGKNAGFTTDGILYSQSAEPFITVTEDQARAELGRAQPVTARVRTRYGWTDIGDLDPGDEIENPDGGFQTVSAIYPQGNLETERIVLESGRHTESSKDHLWVVRTETADPQEYVTTTSRLRVGIRLPLMAG